MKQTERFKREKRRRGFAIILWGLVGISLFIVIGYRMYGKEWKQYWNPVVDDKCNDNFTVYEQENLAVSGDFLYYCDLNRETALCSYNLKTKEIEVLKQRAGALKKTGTGIYYITDSTVYRISGEGLRLVCDIPAKGFDFIDFYENVVYWTGKERGTDETKKDLPVLQYSIYMQNVAGENEPELIFQSEDMVYDIVLVQQNIYVMTENAICKIESGTGEMKKLPDIYGVKFYTNGSRTLFEGSDEDGKGYYEILQDGAIKKLTLHTGSVAAVFQECLYYIDEVGLKACDLKAETVQEKLLFKMPGRSWYQMEVCEQWVILRDAALNHIWFCDLKSGATEDMILQ